MKRYIITIKEFQGITIKRFDGYFRPPFQTVERFTEDQDGWCWSSRTAAHLKLLLRRMERLEKADRVDDRKDRFTETWVVDVMDGLAVGQYLPYGDRPQKVMLPSMEVIEKIDLGPDPYDVLGVRLKLRVIK